MKRQLYSETIKMGREQFFNTYAQMTEGTVHHMLLESGRGGRYSICGMKPLARYESIDHVRTKVTTAQGERIVEEETLSFIERERLRLQPSEVETTVPFAGGFLGFVTYDAVRRYVSLEETTAHVMTIPDVVYYLFERIAVYDQKTQDVTLFVYGSHEALKMWKEEWERLTKEVIVSSIPSTSIPSTSIRPIVVQRHMTEEQFTEGVRTIQHAIARQEVTQVNLTVLQTAKSDVAPFRMYRTLRTLNPSPYMGYVAHDQFHVVSGSPELLLKKRGRKIETRPIGGTRKRGATEKEDALLVEDLRNAHKDLEEHEMLVALEMKDFQKVCEQHTVRVDDSQVIEKYSHVMHLVSNVVGTLREDVHLPEMVEAIFPGGSITGDPKIRTLQLIEQLEPTRRHLYTGSIGWISWNGDMEWNIVIRTAVVQHNTYYVQAGAGITDQSVAADEYEESLLKAEALFEALRRTE